MTPRKPEDFETIREKSKNNIATAALKVFAEHGYYKSSIAMIAKEAGISKGLIYNYFKSKNELLGNVFMEGFKYFNTIIDLDRKEMSAFDKLEMIMKNFLTSLKDNLQFWKLYQNILSQPAVLKNIPKFKEYFESVFGPLLMEIFYEMYHETMNEMEIQIEVMIFAAIMDGIGFDYVVIGEEYPLDAIGEKILLNYKNSIK